MEVLCDHDHWHPNPWVKLHAQGPHHPWSPPPTPAPFHSYLLWASEPERRLNCREDSCVSLGTPVCLRLHLHRDTCGLSAALLFSVCTAGVDFQEMRILCFDLIEAPEATPNPSSCFPVHFLIGLPSVRGMMTSQGWRARPGRESGDSIHFLWDVFWFLPWYGGAVRTAGLTSFWPFPRQGQSTFYFWKPALSMLRNELGSGRTLGVTHSSLWFVWGTEGSSEGKRIT